MKKMNEITVDHEKDPETEKYDAKLDCDAVGLGILADVPVVTNAEAFGKFVVRAALGQEELPTDQKALRELLTRNGLKLPDNQDVQVEVVQRDEKTVTVVLPPREMIRAALCVMRAIDSKNKAAGETQTWSTIPGPYCEYKDGSWFKGKTNANELFYMHRLADYSVSYCR